ncbi:polynucleotidyl transferase, ribonuclease H-like superfamily protein 1 [Artemisia annua]|uniref:Polynucleotidyl transferase, ribonuclease H-like superfamily protein 1 n=1 Tax=Artemisia annua TaxID=35608 RepID=A0A2U1M444_ARTAN|nr:polynucleotidyl transferase, ribonuclease H-like superfamily protein 1 [Artemisia annua]
MHEPSQTRTSTWSPPPPGRFKMNTDGGCRRPNKGPITKGPSGYGGILRDHRGKWVRGFRGFIGVSDSLAAEIHGIYNGLLLLDQLGFRRSILESDSAAAIRWIEQNDCSIYYGKSAIIQACWSIIMECKRLISKNQIVLNFCPRAANKCADKLANIAIEKKELFVRLKKLPEEMKDIVEREHSMVKLYSSYIPY